LFLVSSILRRRHLEYGVLKDLIIAAAWTPIMNDGALVGLETIDGMTEACATRRPPPWTRSSLSTAGIRVGTDSRSAHCVTEAGPAGPRQLDQVLSALNWGPE